MYKNKYLTFIVFLFILVIGLIVYKDYNIYGDEFFHQYAGSIYYLHLKETLLNLDFNNIHFHEIQRLLKNVHMSPWFIYPMFFELLTEFVIDIFSFEASKEIFEIRHLTNFIIFYISLIFFFKILSERFKNNYLAILGILILFFTPRFFAESFYNSKDLLFMSFTIIHLYFSNKFINYLTIKNLFYFSITAGILINIRVYGIIFPLISFFFIFIESIENKKKLLKNIKLSLISILLIIFTIYIFWPFLWTSPIKNFLVYAEWLSSAYKFLIPNVYLGEVIYSNQVPWHFVLVWILITMPLVIILFCILGLYLLSRKFFNNLLKIDTTNKLWLNNLEKTDFFVFISILFFLLLALTSHTIHGGWRYFYFLYPFMIYISLIFLENIKSIKGGIYSFSIFCIIMNLLLNVDWIFKNHPNQNYYFNPIKKYFIKKNFDVDYWGLSERQALYFILENDKKKILKVSSIGKTWIAGSFIMLEPNLKKRLKHVEPNDADYILDRGVTGNKKIDLKNFKNYNEFTIDGNIVYTIYKRVK